MFITKKQIRKELYSRFPEESEKELKDAYKWITDAPFWQWKDRLWCVGRKGYISKGQYEAVYKFLVKGVLSEELSQEQDKDDLLRQLDAQMK